MHALFMRRPKLGDTIMNWKRLQNLQPTKQEDKRQRDSMDGPNLKTPDHINGEEKNGEIKADVDDSETEIETPERHALGLDGFVPKTIDRNTQEDCCYCFCKPPRCDHSKKDVDCHLELRCDKYSSIHQKGCHFDGRCRGNVYLIEGVDCFQEEKLVSDGNNINMSTCPIDDTCIMNQSHSRGTWVEL